MEAAKTDVQKNRKIINGYIAATVVLTIITVALIIAIIVITVGMNNKSSSATSLVTRDVKNNIIDYPINDQPFDTDVKHELPTVEPKRTIEFSPRKETTPGKETIREKSFSPIIGSPIDSETWAKYAEANNPIPIVGQNHPTRKMRQQTTSDGKMYRAFVNGEGLAKMNSMYYFGNE